MRIVFADDGKGIPPENIGKVFDPFFTTGRSSGSTGLGLHIVYNLVTSRLQGRINLYSKVGKGTRFTIDIPKTVAEAQPDAAPERKTSARRSLGYANMPPLPRSRRRAPLAVRPAAAKTLVYCSEGNPESLNPQIVTTTTGMNAGAADVQQPGGVSAGLDRARARAGGDVGDFGRRTGIRLPSPPWREIPVERDLHSRRAR